MQHLEVSCAVLRFFKSLGFKGLTLQIWGGGSMGRGALRRIMLCPVCVAPPPSPQNCALA